MDLYRCRSDTLTQIMHSLDRPSAFWHDLMRAALGDSYQNGNLIQSGWRMLVILRRREY